MDVSNKYVLMNKIFQYSIYLQCKKYYYMFFNWACTMTLDEVLVTDQSPHFGSNWILIP